MEILKILSFPILAFLTIMISAFGMQWALNRQAEREVKKDYPKWYKEHWHKERDYDCWRLSNNAN